MLTKKPSFFFCLFLTKSLIGIRSVHEGKINHGCVNCDKTNLARKSVCLIFRFSPPSRSLDRSHKGGYNRKTNSSDIQTTLLYSSHSPERMQVNPENQGHAHIKIESTTHTDRERETERDFHYYYKIRFTGSAVMVSS